MRALTMDNFDKENFRISAAETEKAANANRLAGYPQL
jgi:hypothetical protein